MAHPYRRLRRDDYFHRQGQSNPKMEATKTSEMSVTLHQLIWRHIPDDPKIIYVVLIINLLMNTVFGWIRKEKTFRPHLT